MARRWSYGENWEDRKCLIKSTYIVWFWSQFSGLFGVWSRSHRCDNYEAKVIAPPTGSRSVWFFKMLWIHHLTFTQFASTTSSEYCKNMADVKLWREYWYLKYCCHGNVFKPQYSYFGDFEAIRAFLGGFNMVKNSWKFAHTLEPVAVRMPRGWDPGRGTEALRRPWNTSENLMCSSHILARIHMKLGTTYRSHRAEQLLHRMSWAPPNRKSAILLFSLGLFLGFFDYTDIFGGLNMVKTLENVHTHWNPRHLGRRWGWDQAWHRGSRRPLEHHQRKLDV